MRSFGLGSGFHTSRNNYCPHDNGDLLWASLNSSGAMSSHQAFLRPTAHQPNYDDHGYFKIVCTENLFIMRRLYNLQSFEKTRGLYMLKILFLQLFWLFWVCGQWALGFHKTCDGL